MLVSARMGNEPFQFVANNTERTQITISEKHYKPIVCAQKCDQLCVARYVIDRGPKTNEQQIYIWITHTHTHACIQ